MKTKSRLLACLITLALSFWACSSDKGSSKPDEDAVIDEKGNTLFGDCTADSVGVIKIDTSTQIKYVCDNQKWTAQEPEETPAAPLQDTISDGVYNCADNSGNSARFSFNEGSLSYKYDVGFSFSSQSASPFTYSQATTVYGKFAKGKFYSMLVATSSEMFPFDDVTDLAMKYVGYDYVHDSLVVMSCEKESEKEEFVLNWEYPFNDDVSYGQLKDDRDGRVYKTIKIGYMNWMAENMKLAESGSLCYDDLVQNCARFGRLYPWNVAMKSGKGICPTGWHIPTKQDWSEFKIMVETDFPDSSAVYLRSKGIWNESSATIGNNRTGFSALPGGQFNLDGEYERLGSYASWWSADTAKVGMAYSYTLWSSSNKIYESTDDIGQANAVRCVENAEDRIPIRYGFPYGSLVDSRDNQTYLTTMIDGKEWMAQNLNYSTESGWSCYDNDPKNCSQYGKLYTWLTVMQSEWPSSAIPSGVKGLCPVGWHLPSNTEMDSLFHYLSLQSGNRNLNANYLKAQWVWLNEQTNDSTNKFGFTALPGGARFNGKYSGQGTNGTWWTSMGTAEGERYFYSLDTGGSIARMLQGGEITNAYIENSVRCVKDYIGLTDSAFGACTFVLQDSVRSITKGTVTQYYTCDSTHWRIAEAQEQMNYRRAQALGVCSSAMEGEFKVITAVGISESFACLSGKWVQGTAEEIQKQTIVDSLGECNSSKNGFVGSVQGQYYTCVNPNWRASISNEVFSAKLIAEKGVCNALKIDQLAEVTYNSETRNYFCNGSNWVTPSAADLERVRLLKILGTCAVQTEGNVALDSASRSTSNPLGDYYKCTSSKWVLMDAMQTDIAARGTCTVAREGELFKGMDAEYWCVSGVWQYYLKGTFKDVRDGRVYETTRFNGKIWLAENLAYDPTNTIPVGTKSPVQKYCESLNLTSCALQGMGYTWNTATGGVATNANIQGICPSGWYLPTTQVYNELEEYISKRGKNPSARIDTKLRATFGWNTNSSGYELGVDDFGFKTVATLYANSTGYDFLPEEYNSSWWAATSDTSFSLTDVFAIILDGVYTTRVDFVSKYPVRCWSPY